MITDMLKRAASGVVFVCVAGFSSSVVAQDQPPRQQPAPAVADSVGSPGFDASQASFSFSAVKLPGGALSFKGQVPSEATLRYLSNRAGVVVDRLAVTPNAPDDFGVKLQLGLRALMELEQGRLTLASGEWALTGEVDGNDEAERIRSALGSDVTAKLTVAVSRDACHNRLAELSSHNALLFRSGSATLADSAAAELDLFAEALSQCGNVLVDVEGHTDTDGDDQKNLILSVMRAEAVVKALITRGVAEERLYAVGYGETLPISSNDTQAGKAANRRIVIKLRD